MGCQRLFEAFTVQPHSYKGVYRAHALQVLTVTGAGVARVVAFLDADLFTLCGLPPSLDATGATGA